LAAIKTNAAVVWQQAAQRLRGANRSAWHDSTK